MPRLIALVLVLALVSAVDGCTYGEVQAQGKIGEPIRETCHRWLWGLIVPDAYYPTAMGRVQMSLGPIDWFLTVITGGIYAPVSITVWPLLPDRPQVIVVPQPPAQKASK